ncbi:hypothetical protein COV20_00620 [Candidatus Woesearchaeota archaeon CG10_big_fil_rev_8_21_14_0_10_45_16]|nr:MAG: hypothetical protein COV20_00620 [Candidatus Woesearchaeota archaeon CG10_big_fil_rev_8_21_14_0_10_45_16]
MNRKISLYLVCLVFLVLAASFVSAPAAGGGATGGTYSRDSSGGGGDGPYFYGLKCLDTGQLTFKQRPPINPVVIEKEDGINFTVTGEWKGTTFTSEEAEISDAGTYAVFDPKNGNKTVECPGLKFSCKLVELNIQNCSYKKDKVTVEFTLTGKGTSIEDIEFQFQKQNSSQSLKYQKNVMISTGLNSVFLQERENGSYLLETTSGSPVSMIKATYPRCIGEHYLYSKLNCMEREESQQEEVIEDKYDESSFKEVIKDKRNEPLEEKKTENTILKMIFFFRKWFSVN